MDNTGKLGVGNTGPSAKLDVYGVAGDDRIARFESPDDGAYIQIRDNDTLGQLTVKDGLMAMGLGGAYPGTTMLNINTSGNVGIGTTTPDSKLDVTGGDITVNTNSVGFMTFKYGTAGSESTMGSIQTTGIDLKINATSDLLLLPGSNVGIGTTSPNYKLSVDASTAGDYAALINNSNSTNGYGLLVRTAHTGASAYAFAARAGSSDIFVVRADGNVGIGDPSPSSISANTFSLSVNSSRNDLSGALLTKANGTIKHQQYWDSSGYSFNLTASSGSFQFNGANVGIGVTTPTKNLSIAYSSTEQDVLLEGLAGASAGSGLLIFNTDTTTNKPFANIDFRAGNADARIAVQREDANSGNFHFITDNSGTIATKMFLKHNGQLGLGTVTPAKSLELSYSQSTTDVNDNLSGASAGTGILLRNNAATGFANVDFRINDADGRIAYKFEASNKGNFHFITDNATVIDTKMFIKYSGEVGIGTTSPSEKLSVDGNISTSGDVILGTPSRIVLKDQPLASTTSGSGTIVKWTVSSATTVGQVYSIKADGGWATVASSGFQATLMLGYSLGTDSTQGILLQGFLYKSSHGLTIGAPIYIGGSQGALTNTAPTTTGHFVRIIGYATSTNYIYFDPDKTWIELV